MKTGSAKCALSKGFSLWEKLYAQLTFNVMGIIGTAGILRAASWPWLLPYIAVYWYGIPGIIMRHINCPRCPHLYRYGDCLQAPAFIAKWLIKTSKTAPLGLVEKGVFLLIFTMIPAYPLYWLRAQPMLLTVFVLAAVLWYLGQLLYFCVRCRVKECPFNRAGLMSAE